MLPFLPRRPGVSSPRRRPPSPSSAYDAAQGLVDLRFVRPSNPEPLILEHAANHRALLNPNSQIRASNGANGRAISTRPSPIPPLRPRRMTAPTSRTTRRRMMTARPPSRGTAQTTQPPPQQAPRGPRTPRWTSARRRFCHRPRSFWPSPRPNAA